MCLCTAKFLEETWNVSKKPKIYMFFPFRQMRKFYDEPAATESTDSYFIYYYFYVIDKKTQPRRMNIDRYKNKWKTCAKRNQFISLSSIKLHPGSSSIYLNNIY